MIFWQYLKRAKCWVSFKPNLETYQLQKEDILSCQPKRDTHESKEPQKLVDLIKQSKTGYITKQELPEYNTSISRDSNSMLVMIRVNPMILQITLIGLLDGEEWHS
jgi:hypothetical protein